MEMQEEEEEGGGGGGWTTPFFIWETTMMKQETLFLAHFERWVFGLQNKDPIYKMPISPWWANKLHGPCFSLVAMEMGW